MYSANIYIYIYIYVYIYIYIYIYVDVYMYTRMSVCVLCGRAFTAFVDIVIQHGLGPDFEWH